jgi:hypothetical protein
MLALAAAAPTLDVSTYLGGNALTGARSGGDQPNVRLTPVWAAFWLRRS